MQRAARDLQERLPTLIATVPFASHLLEEAALLGINPSPSDEVLGQLLAKYICRTIDVAIAAKDGKDVSSDISSALPGYAVTTFDVMHLSGPKPLPAKGLERALAEYATDSPSIWWNVLAHPNVLSELLVFQAIPYLTAEHLMARRYDMMVSTVAVETEADAARWNKVLAAAQLVGAILGTAALLASAGLAAGIALPVTAIAAAGGASGVIGLGQLAMAVGSAAQVAFQGDSAVARAVVKRYGRFYDGGSALAGAGRIMELQSHFNRQTDDALIAVLMAAASMGVAEWRATKLLLDTWGFLTDVVTVVESTQALAG